VSSEDAGMSGYAPTFLAATMDTIFLLPEILLAEQAWL
jgi:hypothetical protein